MIVDEHYIVAGRLFQTSGPQTENARLPNLVIRILTYLILNDVRLGKQVLHSAQSPMRFLKLFTGLALQKSQFFELGRPTVTNIYNALTEKT